MLGWTRLTRTVSVWKRTTPCAKRRKVSARRNIRSWCRSTSTYATEDDDIVGFSFLHSKFGFLEGRKVETEMLSVKMHQTEATSCQECNHRSTQLLENVSEQSSKSSLSYMRKKVHQDKEEQRREWEGQQRIEELCSKFYNRTQDLWRQHSSGTPTMSCCGEEKSFLEENHKWVNIMALRELYGPGSVCG